MMADTKHSSLRESLEDAIGSFLYFENFQRNPILIKGIIEAINLISDYHEEGVPLFPEVLITSDLSFFSTIPNKELFIKEGNLEVDEFKNAIKLCAPLAVNGWIIFVEVKDECIKYGLTTSDISETSPSIYTQTVGSLKVDISTPIAYIRNIGQKTVELAGVKKRIKVSLNLHEPNDTSNDEVNALSVSISSKCDGRYREKIKTFFEKTIDRGLKIGHGNLIGVIDDDDIFMNRFQNELKVNGGIYLKSPIDFELLIIEAENLKNDESSINLRQHSSLLISMLNHDGILIISNKARLIGYHFLIENYDGETPLVGGARTKAFYSMKNCKFFHSCFFKSQDGNVKFWNHE